MKVMTISMSTKEIVSEYCRSTSAHGIGYIVSSSHTVKKIGWILILCGVLTGSSYHIYVLISSYLEYNYYTSITVDTDKPLMVSTENHFHKSQTATFQQWSLYIRHRRIKLKFSYRWFEQPNILRTSDKLLRSNFSWGLSPQADGLYVYVLWTREVPKVNRRTDRQTTANSIVPLSHFMRVGDKKCPFRPWGS